MESPVLLLSPNQLNIDRPPILNKDCFKTESSVSITDDDVTFEEALYHHQLSSPFFQTLKKTVRFGDILPDESEPPATVKIKVEPKPAKRHGSNHLTELFRSSKKEEMDCDTRDNEEQKPALFFNNDDSIPDLNVSLYHPVSVEPVANLEEENHSTLDEKRLHKENGGLRKLFSFRGKKHIRQNVLEDELNETRETLEFQKKMCNSLGEYVCELEAKVDALTGDIMRLQNEKKIFCEQIDSLGKKCEDSHEAFKSQQQKARLETEKLSCLQQQHEDMLRAQKELLQLCDKMGVNNKQHLICQEMGLFLIDYLVSVFDSIIIPTSFAERDTTNATDSMFQIDSFQARLHSLKINEIEQLKNILAGGLDTTSGRSVAELVEPMWVLKSDIMNSLSTL